MDAQAFRGTDADGTAVRAAVDGFYAALNAMFGGDLGPMKDVWSHAEDVTYLGPSGGFRVGWAEVLADLEAQAAMDLGGEVSPRSVRITAVGDLAVVVNHETGENLGPDGEPRKVEIRATNVFRREDGLWKMIGHHTDILPFLRE